MPQAGQILFLALISRFNPDKQLIPFVVFACGSAAPTRERLIQQMDVGDQIRLHPSPVGKPSTAGAADLISQELDGTITNPIIVWFDNPVFAPVKEADQASVLDSHSQQFVDVRFTAFQISGVLDHFSCKLAAAEFPFRSHQLRLFGF